MIIELALHYIGMAMAVLAIMLGLSVLVISVMGWWTRIFPAKYWVTCISCGKRHALRMPESGSGACRFDCDCGKEIRAMVPGGAF